MDYLKVFDSIRRYFEVYFGVEGDFHEYQGEFYHFSFEREKCLKESLKDLKSEKSLESFLDSFLDFKEETKLKDSYKFFVNLGENDGKINFVFLKRRLF